MIADLHAPSVPLAPPRFQYELMHRDELRLGFKGKTISFEHRAFDDRTPDAQRAYLALRDDLLSNGMVDPLITYTGHVLIGMRRFEIMRGEHELFACVEILEPVETWGLTEARALNAFADALYTGTTQYRTGDV